MRILERLADALFAFRHGLPPVGQEPRTMPGPWFVNERWQPGTNRPGWREQFAAWRRAKFGDDMRLPIGSSLPDLDWSDGEPVKLIGPAH